MRISKKNTREEQIIFIDLTEEMSTQIKNYLISQLQTYC
jgi:hypothetical protein